VTRRRPRVDFFHLFDEDELFPVRIILIAKKFRMSLGVATISRLKLGAATTSRTKIGIATVTRSKAQG